MRRASKKHPKFIVIVARSLLMVLYGKKLKSRRAKMKHAKYSPSESNKWLNCPPSLSESNLLDIEYMKLESIHCALQELKNKYSIPDDDCDLEDAFQFTEDLREPYLKEVNNDTA